MITRKNVEYQIIKDLPVANITTTTIGKGTDLAYSYKCHLLIDQIAAYESGARIAKIEVVSDLPTKSFVNPNQQDAVTDNNTINSLLISDSERRNASLIDRDNDLKKKVIFNDRIDIFSKSTKMSLEKLRKNNFLDISKNRIQYQEKSNLSSKTAFDQIQDQNISNSNLGSLRVYSDLMMNGKDPAKQIVVRSSINDAVLARSGLGEVISSKNDKIISEFLTIQNAAQAKNTDEQNNQATVIKSQTTDVLLPVFFTVSALDTSNLKQIVLIVSINDSDDKLVQKKEFLINHTEQINKSNLPNLLPKIGIQKTSDNLINVNVFCPDDLVSNVNVYVRYFKNFGSSNYQEPFIKCASIDLSDGASYYNSKVKIKSLKANQTILRAVPALTSGIQLGNFESKSFLNKTDTVQGVLYAYFVQDQVSVKLFGAPASYEYIQFMRRSVTKNEKIFTDVGSILSVDNGSVEFTDQDIKSNHVYEYTAMLKNRAGSSKRISSTTIVRTSNYTSGTSLTASILSQEVTDASVKTKFNIDINLTKDTDTTLLLQNLKNSGIDNYYETEITKLSADLKNIVKVYVRRINTLTGTTTDLGIVDAGEFEDTAPKGEVYIFEGLIRSQADLLEEIGSNFVSSKILDPRDGSERGKLSSQILSSTEKISKKNYTQKFFSKKSLLKGTLSYGITRDYAEDDSGFLSGRIGIADVIENSKLNQDAIISNANLITSDRKKRLLSFDVAAGSEQLIDFFIISSNRGVNTSVVGVCHYNTEKSTQYFMDTVSDFLNGSISYTITPILYGGIILREYKTQNFEVV